MRVKKLVTIALLGVASVMTFTSPAHAASKSITSKTVNWNQHDTAVYVVSTLNLLRTRTGRPIVANLSRRLNVTHYDVYADQTQSNLYFIQLRRDDGTVVGAFAYHMGWAKPRPVSGTARHFVSGRIPGTLQQEYNSDQKFLIGSFTSTMPS